MASNGDSMEFGGPPAKKLKGETDDRFETDSDNKFGKSESLTYSRRRFLRDDKDREEHRRRQHELFYYQFAKSEGFVIEWDKFDTLFFCRSHAQARRSGLLREQSRPEHIHRLTLHALNRYNKEKGASLEFVEHVDANFMLCLVYVFWITFRARDLSSSDSEPKLYQTRVLKFRDGIAVCMFRPRPTDEEIASVNVDPPPAFFYRRARAPVYWARFCPLSKPDTNVGSDTDSDGKFKGSKSTTYGGRSFPSKYVEDKLFCYLFEAHVGPLVWFGYPLLRKQKIYTGTDTGSCAETDSGSNINSDTRIPGCIFPRKEFPRACLADDEWQRQRQLYHHQFIKTEGFEIEWDKFDYCFDLAPVDWWAYYPGYGKTFAEMVHKVTVYAIDKHNQEKGTNLALVELVAANYRDSMGIVFWITFSAGDASASDTEPRLYQTEIWWKLFREIVVDIFRPRPTDEEMDAIEVPPLPPLLI